MTIQVIKSLDARDEYVLFPIAVYHSLQTQIEKALTMHQSVKEDDYVPFLLEDYVDNPVAIARIKVNLTQEQLAKNMNVSQAYISKLENQQNVSSKTMQKVSLALQMNQHD